jgi:NhaP-type Na+/H+ or K+/H+ antiporter
MDVTMAVICAAVFGWGLLSARLERVNLTAPMVFIAVGGALAGLGLINGPSAPEAVAPLVEITLVWVLFSDAARLPVQQLRRDLGRYVRLLAVGLPLTIALGWALAAWFFPQLGLWLALLVGAALAPTDAALGVPVVTNSTVPSRIRQLITVESGLNDGIATPVVMLAIAGSAAAAGLEHAEGAGQAIVELLIGAAVGAGVGSLGGWLIRQARRRGSAAEDFAGIAVLALALLAYASALGAGGNGFVAAFCGGLAFGACAGRRGSAELIFLEQMGSMV